MRFRIYKDAFIKAPYRPCPACGADSFGVFSVGRQSYERKCRACGQTAEFGLPPVRKKLVYLDQFAVSNILKAEKPELRQNRPIDPFWTDTAERLFRLGGMQLIACPPSIVHMRESIVDDRIFQGVQKVYNYLAFGSRLLNYHHVRALQTAKGFRAFLAESEESVATPASDIVRGHDGWHDRWEVLPLVPDDTEAAEFFRKHRQEGSVDLNKLFAEWGEEKSVTFEERYEKESRAAGPTFENHIRQLIRSHPLLFHQIALTHGEIPPGIPFDVLSPDMRLFLHAVFGVIGEASLPLDEGPRRLQQFLRSEAAARLPQNHITGLMYAALGELAKQGRKKPLSPGMADDIRVISTYLPYFDAMFVDDECRRLLTSKNVAPRMPYSAKVFSTSNRSDFMAYLDGIGAEASAEHEQAVQEVYGDRPTLLADLLATDGPVVGLGADAAASGEAE